MKCFFIYTIIEKVNNLVRKKYLHFVLKSLQEPRNLGSFRRAEFFISLKTLSTLTNGNDNLKDRRIGDITDSNDTWMFTIFENWFHHRMRYFLSKGGYLLQTWDLEVVNWV